jgi:hypothetical protein
MIQVLLLIIIVAVALIVPTARILRRVGLPPVWSVLAVVPFVNVVGLWLFAHAHWPAVIEKTPELPDYH